MSLLRIRMGLRLYAERDPCREIDWLRAREFPGLDIEVRFFICPLARKVPPRRRSCSFGGAEATSYLEELGYFDESCQASDDMQPEEADRFGVRLQVIADDLARRRGDASVADEMVSEIRRMGQWYPVRVNDFETISRRVLCPDCEFRSRS